MHWGRSAKVLLGVVAAILLVSTGSAGAASGVQATSTHTVTFASAAVFRRPPSTGHIIEPISAQPLVLAANGYVQQEFFASGTATAFRATSTPSDGKWSITPTTTAHYATRILVRRPSDPAKFNGTVVVEWMNVSDGESAPDWQYLNPMLMRDGYAYVAVSAQALGVDGGKAILGQAAAGTQGLVQEEPARYGTLHHPGDQYALDMFAQIGKALKAPHPTVLGGLRPKRIVAVGESQSAAPDEHLRRYLHSQPGWIRCTAERVGYIKAGSEQLADSDRSQGPGFHGRDPDRSRRTGLCAGPAAEHRSNQDVGGGWHLPRGYL